MLKNSCTNLHSWGLRSHLASISVFIKGPARVSLEEAALMAGCPRAQRTETGSPAVGCPCGPGSLSPRRVCRCAASGGFRQTGGSVPALFPHTLTWDCPASAKRKKVGHQGPLKCVLCSLKGAPRLWTAQQLSLPRRGARSCPGLLHVWWLPADWGSWHRGHPGQATPVAI